MQPHRALHVVEGDEVGQPVEDPQGEGRPSALDPALRHAHADAERPAVGEPARARRLAHPQRDAGVELLPDPGHGEEDRRRDLADVVGHGVDGLGEVDGAARAQRIEDGERALRDVGEGQERQLLIALARRREVVGEAQLEDDVAMAQHGALRRPGGAGGVDEDGEVVGAGDLDQRVPGAGMLVLVAGAQVEEVVEGHHLWIGEAVQPLDVEHDDLHEPGAARADFQDLVELLLVAGEEEAGAAVVDDVLDLARRIRGVDAVGHAAHRHRPQIRVQPLRPVLREDRHHVARPQAEGHQAEPDTPRALAIVAPGDGPPHAEVLLAHGHGVAALPDDVTEEPRQGVLPVHGGGAAQRHVFFRFHRRVPRTLCSFMPR